MCEPQKINIFSYADNKIEASYNVVKFNSISITYDKKLYFDKENIGTVRFHTEKYDKIISFDINQGNVVIPFDDGDIVLSPPVLRWKFGDSEFSSQYREDLWYRNYSNSASLLLFCLQKWDTKCSWITTLFCPTAQHSIHLSLAKLSGLCCKMVGMKLSYS